MAAERSGVSQGNCEGGKPIVLILVGAPGSGKSTFCNNVMKGALRQWVRVCQDIIANGKAGTKVQCLKKASDALKERKNVFIDRCNLERGQRAEFIQLGEQQADVHAVVLDLPAQLCIARSVKRTEHEGGLKGGSAAAVVNRMLQKKEMPKLNEGFSRISFCHTEADVEDSVDTYRKLGPSDSLTPGCFGQRSSDAKVQVGIMKFLKKLQPSENADVCQVSDFEKDKEAKEGPSGEELKEPIPSSGLLDTRVKGRHNLSKDVSVADYYTLAFPSISTSDFQFSLEKASEIIVEEVSEFLSRTENLRLVLVDLTEQSKILAMVNAKAAQRKIDKKRFCTFVGDITRLYSGGCLRCNVIANAANWRLKPGGGGVNAAIFNAAGEDFERATKSQAQTLNPGNAVAVPLPADSLLLRRESISHVIHVLGPNMNPNRPNYLGKDYVKGCDVLRRAYSSLFCSFASIAQTAKLPVEHSQKCITGPIGENHIQENLNDHSIKNAEQKVKREGLRELDTESNRKCKGESPVLPKGDLSHSSFGCKRYSTGSSVDEPLEDMPARVETNVESKEKSINEYKKSWASWTQCLYHIAMHPDEHRKEVIELSESTVTIYDLYPKAKKHLLIVARLHGLDSLADVRKEHIQLLKEMQSVGLRWAKKFTSEDPSTGFRLGYHSVPSMRQLHLHVISQDFESTYLKHKKHWNSFNTPFFRDSVDVIEELENHGKVSIKEESFLSMELRCHRCRSAHPNIPHLKCHIQKCNASFPASLLTHGRLYYTLPQNLGSGV
ncbi:Transcription factor [Nymphaea thermarum]|nr:Transcription factor [Nymphaea thermarum]